MILSNDLQKLKSSLSDAINAWMNKEAEKDKGWSALDTSVSDNISELMSEAAFSVLLAQKDLTTYLKKDGQLD